MRWIDRVDCPCGKPDWAVTAGDWRCRHCWKSVTAKAIKAVHYADDCKRWLAAEAEHRRGQSEKMP